MKKKHSPLPFLIIAAVLAAAWAWQHYYYNGGKREQLAAGTPLDQTHSQINVLTPSSEETPTQLPTGTSSNAIIGEPHGPAAASSTAMVDTAPIVLTSATVITTPQAPAMVDTAAQIANLQLGVLLAMVSQQYANGGPAALVTLGSAEQLAGHGLKQKIVDLRRATPPGGPITPALLLVEAQRVRALGAPEGDLDNPKPEPTGWLRKLVQVRDLSPKQTVGWGRAFNAVLLQLAANNPAGAQSLLTEVPLKGDNRLDDLRTALEDYARQAEALSAVLAAYANQAAQP